MDPVLAYAFRGLLALIFLTAAAHKLRAPREFAGTIRAYELVPSRAAALKHERVQRAVQHHEDKRGGRGGTRPPSGETRSRKEHRHRAQAVPPPEVEHVPRGTRRQRQRHPRNAAAGEVGRRHLG